MPLVFSKWQPLLTEIKSLCNGMKETWWRPRQDVSGARRGGCGQVMWHWYPSLTGHLKFVQHMVGSLLVFHKSNLKIIPIAISKRNTRLKKYSSNSGICHLSSYYIKVELFCSLSPCSIQINVKWTLFPSESIVLQWRIHARLSQLRQVGVMFKDKLKEHTSDTTLRFQE